MPQFLFRAKLRDEASVEASLACSSSPRVPVAPSGRGTEPPKDAISPAHSCLPTPAAILFRAQYISMPSPRVFSYFTLRLSLSA